MFGTSIFSGSSSIVSFISKATNSFATSLGCPSLSSIGLSFSNIYNLLKTNQDEINSEIKNYSLQSSTYNKIIPEIFGRVRISGNIMWVSEIKKTSIYHPKKMTKNGTQTAYTENLVRGSFAIAICKGVIDEIKNIYVNNEPLNLSTYNIKIYYGDEKQKTDTTMQSYLGTNIPAFKGLCYVVFNDFPMEEFGGTIPNFTFDVVRNKEIQEENDMEQLVSCINIIPGSGEFVYDTKTQKKLNGSWIYGNFYETQKPTILNNHSFTNYTDAVDSLNDLQKTFPNLKYVSLIVCWFCNSLDCKDDVVYPACENNAITTIPDEWEVNGLKRTGARTIGLDEDGNIRYGGTPSDECVKRYAKEIKNRGLKLCLYPMLMVDVDKKPWRGHIKGDVDDIHNFFVKDNGYNNFIKHYTRLLKDDIDVVIIGSEMIGLTSVFDDKNNNYPAVDEFCNLAQDIKNIVNNNTKITYTADWSEYHHNDRGDYNMDKLWADKNIDFIGIDAYFPLTDKSETTYNIDEIKNGWFSGEGYDFYYKDKQRTIKEKLNEKYAWKNLKWFIENEHYNTDGTKTLWKPKSKKIWFMEYGFSSVDCCTNQPNVFYSKGSFDSAFPRHSQGVVDFKAQRTAIIATELAWKNSDFVENKFLYTWDARPYPYFPNLKDVWADANCWKYGHFLNGKSGKATLANIINFLLKKIGLNDEDFDTSLLKNDIIDGFLIDDKKSVLSHLKILANTFNFDAYIDNGKIIFKSLINTETHKVNDDDLIIDEKNKKIEFFTENVSNNLVPSKIELLFMDIENDYKTSTAIANDNSEKDNSYSISVNIPMPISQAQQICWNVLSNLANQRTTYIFKLPIQYLNISPLDTISIEIDNEEHLMRVKNVEIIDLTTIKIIAFSIVANENILTNLDYTNDKIIALDKNINNKINEISKTNFEVFELYNIKNEIQKDVLSLYIASWSDNEKFDGATIYYSNDNEQNYQVLDYIKNETTIGKLIKINGNDNKIISPTLIDNETEIIFSLLNEDGKLQSITDDEFLKLKNIILIGDEVVAFRDVEQIEKNIFKISHLLRGRFCTENFISNHKQNEMVVLLDNDLHKIDIPITNIGKDFFIKVLSKGDSLLNVDAKKITIEGKSCSDFQPISLKKNTLKNKNILLSFSKRKNFKVSLNKNIELSGNVLLKIYDTKKNNMIRQEKIENENKFIYSNNMQIEDFGKIISQNDIYFKVENILNLV